MIETFVLDALDHVHDGTFRILKNPLKGNVSITKTTAQANFFHCWYIRIQVLYKVYIYVHTCLLMFYNVQLSSIYLIIVLIRVAFAAFVVRRTNSWVFINNAIDVE